MLDRFFQRLSVSYLLFMLAAMLLVTVCVGVSVALAANPITCAPATGGSLSYTPPAQSSSSSSGATSSTSSSGSSSGGGSTSIAVVGAGKLLWPFDYSYAGVATYNVQDPTAGPVMQFKVTSPYGGWLPSNTPGTSVSLAGLNYLQLDVKPGLNGQALQVYAVMIGDKPEGVAAPFSKYCGTLTASIWINGCKIPISALQLTNLNILKFAVQDITGMTGATFELNNVVFVP